MSNASAQLCYNNRHDEEETCTNLFAILTPSPAPSADSMPLAPCLHNVQANCKNSSRSLDLSLCRRTAFGFGSNMGCPSRTRPSRKHFFPDVRRCVVQGARRRAGGPFRAVLQQNFALRERHSTDCDSFETEEQVPVESEDRFPMRA